MPIVKTANVIVESEIADKARSDKTGVFNSSGFAICDDKKPLKQINFDASAQTDDTTTTIASGAAATDITITMPSASGTFSVGGEGAGAKNGATVTATETGNSVVHKTVLTLASTPVPITSTGSANGFGGVKLYDFPEGRILVLGTMANLSMTVPASEQADFTDDTPEGDAGIGTVIIANADAFGTDATDDDLATGTAVAMTAFADASITCASEPSTQFDGTSTAKDINLNVLIDAADIDDDVSTSVEVSGTVTCTWVNLGDF